MEFLNSALGIVVSILTICGLSAVTYSIVKKINQKVSKNGIASNSEGDSANMSGGNVSGVNVNGNNNNVVVPLCSAPSGDEQNDSIVDMKSTCQILFIDDEKLDTLIKTLKASGWKNIKRIDDTANLDLVDIRNANIIFVDIKGVGVKLKFENEGVGLAAELKRKYPKKGVVIYSATPEHKLFDPDIKMVDDWLYKNAEPIQFSNMIELYGRPKN